MNITNRFALGPYFTFEPSKEKPIYNWFYYKEAYSPEFVERTLDEFEVHGGSVLDPFSGIGTTSLVAKSRGLKAYGIDASPVAVFAGMVKTRNYTEDELGIVREFMKTVFQDKTQQPRIRWDFELFKIEKAFPPANLRDILLLREKIALVENEKAHNLLLLALLSIIPMCSFVMKDGGVLRITKKSVAPAKDMFKRRVKRMLSDLENPILGPEPEIMLGDARDLQFDSNTMDAVITSPPYLNNIDYTKVYGLEISLMEMDPKSAKLARGRSLRSFITHDAEQTEVPPELGEIGYQLPIAATYFSDMEKVLYETYRVLKPGSSASFVVGNSVIHETHIAVDEILALIGERIGFETEIQVGLERIADVRPVKVKTRESAIIFKKPS